MSKHTLRFVKQNWVIIVSVVSALLFVIKVSSGYSILRLNVENNNNKIESIKSKMTVFNNKLNRIENSISNIDGKLTILIKRTRDGN